MPREFNRGTRVADLIQREVAQIIQRELEDPRVDLITINEVKVTRDLAYADIYFTVLPEENAENSQQVLNGASSFLRKQLSKALTTRTTPRLRFHYDQSVDRGARLSKVIDAAVSNDKLRSRSGQ